MGKTHWKKLVSDPNYIGEADFEPGEEKIVTIKTINQSETVATAEGKSKKAVCHFAEAGIKPMILNVARSKSIEKVAGSGLVEDWPGVRIQLYIEHGIKAFGEEVNAVRVRPFRPRAQQPVDIPPCEECGGTISGAGNKSAQWMMLYTRKHYGRALCAACAAKIKAAAEENGADSTENETEEETNDIDQ